MLVKTEPPEISISPNAGPFTKTSVGTLELVYTTCYRWTTGWSSRIYHGLEALAKHLALLASSVDSNIPSQRRRRDGPSFHLSASLEEVAIARGNSDRAVYYQQLGTDCKAQLQSQDNLNQARCIKYHDSFIYRAVETSSVIDSVNSIERAAAAGH
jgi:hypothetical protein